MRLRPMRLALHVVAATALASGGVLLTGSPGSAADTARPDSFGGDSTASAFHYVADRNPQPTPVSDAFHAEVPYATTAFDSSGNASATAASLYPGQGFLGVPALLCQFDPHVCQVISAAPNYPFIATAQYPSQPDDKATVDSGTIQQAQLEVTPGITTAHADASRVESQTKAGSAGVDGVITAGNSVTHSKQTFEGATLVVTAESIVSNIDLGGQLHIDKVRSTATAKVNGGDVTTSTATTTVSGATAGGVPVTIDSEGVHIAGSGDGGAAQGAVNTALAALDASGIKVRLLTPSKSTKDGAASAATGGLLVSFSSTVNAPAIPVPDVPPVNGTYVGSVSVGGAGVTAFAAPAVDVSVPTVGAVPPIAAPPAVAGSVQQPAAGAALSPAAPAVAPADSSLAPATAAAPATQPIAALGVDLTSKRLKTLALVLLGYPLLILLTAPLRAPARLPRWL